MSRNYSITLLSIGEDQWQVTKAPLKPYGYLIGMKGTRSEIEQAIKATGVLTYTIRTARLPTQREIEQEVQVDRQKLADELNGSHRCELSK